MQTIGILGGTSWPSTLDYYRLLNEMVLEVLGGFHSARLCLHSVDYHAIKSRYVDRWDEVPALLAAELQALVSMKPDCIIIANNTLHRAFDDSNCDVDLQGIPMFHIAEETAKAAVQAGHQKLLLLGTKDTMENGYYQSKLEAAGLQVETPSLDDRVLIQDSQTALSLGAPAEDHFDAFRDILSRYAGFDAAVPACTELPLVVVPETTSTPILNPTYIQCRAAVDFALKD